MSLLGTPFLAVLTALVLGAYVAVLGSWARHRSLLGWLGRAGALALLIVVAVAYAGTLVNRSYGFYTTVGDLLGRDSVTRFQTNRELPASRITGWRADTVAAHSGRGSVIPWWFEGKKSGITRLGQIYLPAAYFLPRDRRTYFPVIELFHGSPGMPSNWTTGLHIDQRLDSAIAAGLMPPVIVAIPATNDPGTDQECVNAVHGMRDETYLSEDVPSDILAAFRAESGRRSWAAMGLSTGGFCAVNLALHHPDRYGTVVSLSGNVSPYVDSATGHLFGHSRAALEDNSPLWWVRHRGVPDTPFLLAAGGGDTAAIRELRLLRHAIGPRAAVSTMLIGRGGHNFSVWAAAIPPALVWLAQQLTGSVNLPAGAPANQRPATALVWCQPLVVLPCRTYSSSSC